MLGFGLLYFVHGSIWWIGAAGVVGATALVPPLAKLVVKGYYGLGHVLGWINSKILLTLVYFLILTPIALIYRATGKDPLRLKRPDGAHFLQQRNHRYTKDDLENPW